MPGASFIDTNIWVYAHLQDSNDPRCGRAWALVQRSPSAVISAQVASEYFNVMRRNGTEEPRIQRNLSRMLNRCVVQPMDLAMIRSTLAIRGRYGFSICVGASVKVVQNSRRKTGPIGARGWG
jgi:predicted nucleic acid-binding protein